MFDLFKKNGWIKASIEISLSSLFILPLAVSKPRLSPRKVARLTEQVQRLWVEAELNFPEFTGIVDVTYGLAETKRFNTITGSDKVGFNFPCLVLCSYIELAGNAYGRQWISGKYQKVPGGSGILGALYYYKEPTGRFPVGPKFKIVVWNVDESKGTADLKAFTKVCAGLLGCTPYVLPPGGIDLIEVKEKDTLFTGLIESSVIEDSTDGE